MLIYFKEEKVTLLKDSTPFTKDNWNLNLDGTEVDKSIACFIKK